MPCGKTAGHFIFPASMLVFLHFNLKKQPDEAINPALIFRFSFVYKFGQFIYKPFINLYMFFL